MREAQPAERSCRAKRQDDGSYTAVIRRHGRQRSLPVIATLREFPAAVAEASVQVRAPFDPKQEDEANCSAAHFCYREIPFCRPAGGVFPSDDLNQRKFLE